MTSFWTSTLATSTTKYGRRTARIEHTQIEYTLWLEVKKYLLKYDLLLSDIAFNE